MRKVFMRDLTVRSRVLLFVTVLAALAIVYSLKPTRGADAKTMQTVIAQPFAAAPANPLLAKWEGPYGGVPPFDHVQISLFKPALEAAMTEQLAELDKIAKD